MITTTDLAQIMQCTPQRAALWAPHLNAAMERFDITTRKRITAFLAQIGHESARLTYTAEIWNPTKCPWQLKYEGRADLGNTQPGDGYKFRGRGPMQITGRKNTHLVGMALNTDYETHPDWLERPEDGAASAAWFWRWGAGLNLSKKALAALAKYGLGRGVNLNDIADLGDFETITLCINGGLNGIDDRRTLLKRAQTILMES